MNKVTKIVLALATLAVASRHAAAVDVKIGGQIFASYVHTLSKMNAPLPTTAANAAAGADVEAKGRSSFDVSRVYLIADTKFDDHWKAKITLETNTTTAGNGVFLKQAWLEYMDLYGVDVRGGLVPALWPGVEEAYWQRRYIQKVSSDLWMAQATMDKGVSAHYKLPMGYGKINALYGNGEVYTAGTESADAAQGRQKDISLQATIKPMPDMDMIKNLELHAFVQQGRVKNSVAEGPMDPNRDRNRIAGAVSYKDSWGHFMASYITGKNGLGSHAAGTQKPNVISLHGSYNMPWIEGTSVFLRFDRADAGFPAASVIGYPHRMYLGGVEKKMNDFVRMSADLQMIDGKQKRTAADVGTEQIFARRAETVAGLHVEVKF